MAKKKDATPKTPGRSHERAKAAIRQVSPARTSTGWGVSLARKAIREAAVAPTSAEMLLEVETFMSSFNKAIGVA